MITDISAEDWQRIRQHFGDLAYEHPELHHAMLEILEAEGPPETNNNVK